MHLIQPIGHPFMLARPIGSILWVNIVERGADAAVLFCWHFFPIKRVAKLCLNF
jgi:hypothetical protein